MKNLIPDNASVWLFAIPGQINRSVKTFFSLHHDSKISSDWSPVAELNSKYIISEHSKCGIRFCVYKKVERVVMQRV